MRRSHTAFDYSVNKNLYSIAINATENPVTGYWNAAFLGSQLNLASSSTVLLPEGDDDWGIDKAPCNSRKAVMLVILCFFEPN